MTKQIYPYSQFPIAPSEPYPRGATAHRPLVFANIAASSGLSAESAVLLDSGADNCLFPLRLARLLKLDVETMPREFTGGVGSEANVTFFDHVTINLGKGIEFSAYVGFTEGMDSMAIGLLGQDGFFNRYNVEFRNVEGIFTIESAGV